MRPTVASAVPSPCRGRSTDESTQMKTSKIITFLATDDDLARIARECEYLARRNPDLVRVTRTFAIQTLLARGDLKRTEWPPLKEWFKIKRMSE